MNSAPRPQRRTRTPQAKRTAPTPRQQGILQALADSDAPLSSRELRRRLGLLASEFQGSCASLRAQQYIGRHLKRVKQPAFDASSLKLMAFWFLTEEGYAHLRRAGEAVSDTRP